MYLSDQYCVRNALCACTCRCKRREIQLTPESPKTGVGDEQLGGNASETVRWKPSKTQAQRAPGDSVTGCANLCRHAAIFLAIPLWSQMTITDSGLSFSDVRLHLKTITWVEGPAWSLKRIGVKLGFTKARYLKQNKEKFVQKNYMFHKNFYMQPKTQTKQKPVP